MALQEGDHIRFRCERCYRPLGRFVLDRRHGVGPLLLGETGAYIRKRIDAAREERRDQVRGKRTGRTWSYARDGAEGLGYRYECRCGRTVLLGTARVQRMAATHSTSDAVFLV